MISFYKKLEQEWDNLADKPVLYFSAQDASLLRQAEKWVVARWAESGADAPERIDGPVPDLGEVIATAGAISLFGGRRHVVLRELSPSSLSDKDVKELEELFLDLENATLLVTALYKDKRAAGSKKAKSLMDAAQKVGFAAQLQPPGRTELIAAIREKAEETGATYAPGAAEELLERAGANQVLLETETQKLAAISGYTEITQQMVRQYGARNIEADVFELARLITGGRRGPAQQKLQELFGLRNEPIAIAAALGGTFVDMLRVRLGAEQRKSPEMVFQELGQKGNPYRMVKAKENAARYSTKALEEGVLLLAGLDQALKSSPLSDKTILVQAAVEELIQLRGQ